MPLNGSDKNDEERTSVAYLTFLRCFELVGAGQKSLISNVSGKALKTQIENGNFQNTADSMGPDQGLDKKFKTLRAEADAWHTQRTAYMMARLKAGRHPDLDAAFWNEWHEPPAPPLYAPTARERYARYANIAAVLGVLGVSVLALRFAKKRK